MFILLLCQAPVKKPRMCEGFADSGISTVNLLETLSGYVTQVRAVTLLPFTANVGIRTVPVFSASSSCGYKSLCQRAVHPKGQAAAGALYLIVQPEPLSERHEFQGQLATGDIHPSVHSRFTTLCCCFGIRHKKPPYGRHCLS